MSEQGETSKQTDNTSDKQPLATKVTAVEKSIKLKDPRKVELGKRLAKISREAKERKARQRSEVENKQSPEENCARVRFAKEITDYIDFRYFIGGVTLVATLGGLYYSYKRDKREIKEEKENNDIISSQGREKKSQRDPSRCSIENL